MCENENIQSSYRYYNMGKFSSVSIVIFKVDLALPFEENERYFCSSLLISIWARLC